MHYPAMPSSPTVLHSFIDQAGGDMQTYLTHLMHTLNAAHYSLAASPDAYNDTLAAHDFAMREASLLPSGNAVNLRTCFKALNITELFSAERTSHQTLHRMHREATKQIATDNPLLAHNLAAFYIAACALPSSATGHHYAANTLPAALAMLCLQRAAYSA